jgi:hypothetical protein
MTTPTPRKYCAMMCQFAMDDSAKAWIWNPYQENWITLNEHFDWHDKNIYFVGHEKPTAPPKRMCELGGVSFPEPESVAPAQYADFWVAGLDGPEHHSSWQPCDEYLTFLAQRRIHLKPGAAVLHSKGLAAVNLVAVTGGV